jgi:hypothetical protein
MNTYILFLRNENIDFGSYTPEDMQKIMSDFDSWNAQMIADDRLIASASLQGGEGKVLRYGNIVSDGPYSEAKEAVAGLLLIQARDLEHAVEIAAGCPFIPRGGSVEVRLVPELEFENAAQPILDAHARQRAIKPVTTA